MIRTLPLTGTYLFLAVGLFAQQLPDGPGKAEIEKNCKTCHELARSVSPRQDRDGWTHTMNKMAAAGMKTSEKDFGLMLDYLVKNYPAADVEPVNVNTATAIELESALSLRRSQARALLAYRDAHGPFKSLGDLKKVPNIDAALIDAKKSRIAF
ncbi:MAG: helix-hairpin-helix domain-containing protein [Bryobacterales bacterium]|nr:helix-hairpin-helix domain-containing protein [Bryobacterales bacterium]